MFLSRIKCYMKNIHIFSFHRTLHTPVTKNNNDQTHNLLQGTLIPPHLKNLSLPPPSHHLLSSPLLSIAPCLPFRFTPDETLKKVYNKNFHIGTCPGWPEGRNALALISRENWPGRCLPSNYWRLLLSVLIVNSLRGRSEGESRRKGRKEGMGGREEDWVGGRAAKVWTIRKHLQFSFNHLSFVAKLILGSLRHSV